MMSHFTVGVFIDPKRGKKLGELLAPYQENNMGDCPKEYLEFIECSAEEIKEYEEHKDEYETLNESMAEYYGYKKDMETGKYGYWAKPNAKWDWYKIGGRWSNSILTKNGVECDYAQLKDIDWDKMRENKKREAEKIWDSNPEGIKRYFCGIEKDDTKETYIKRESEFETYAVITPDGKWNSKGKMGWFGASSDNAEDRENWAKSFFDTFIKDADKELILVIVDCHI